MYVPKVLARQVVVVNIESIIIIFLNEMSCIGLGWHLCLSFPYPGFSFNQNMKLLMKCLNYFTGD